MNHSANMLPRDCLTRDSSKVAKMNEKWTDRYKDAKFGKGLTKETAKARYENLEKEKRRESITCRETLVDIKFKQAMAEGEFDNIQGSGKPIDLSNYYDLPEHLRIAYQMIKNSGFIPEEVRLKKEMEELKEKIKTCEIKELKKNLLNQFAEVSQQYHFCMEYNKGFKKTFY